MKGPQTQPHNVLETQRRPRRCPRPRKAVLPLPPSVKAGNASPRQAPFAEPFPALPALTGAPGRRLSAPSWPWGAAWRLHPQPWQRHARGRLRRRRCARSAVGRKRRRLSAAVGRLRSSWRGAPPSELRRLNGEGGGLSGEASPRRVMGSARPVAS